MKLFRTPLKPVPSPKKITLHDAVLTMGSCFAEGIGSRLHQNKFRTSVNPFGTVYNPLSIHHLLEMVLENSPVPEQGFIGSRGMWYHYDFHSVFSGSSQHELSLSIEETVRKQNQLLPEIKWLILTYGTAWIYERKDTGALVANCHKVPNDQFRKRLVREQELVDSFRRLHQKLSRVAPELNILLTVSPVRHLKDTHELNQVSKSVLRTTCHTLTEAFSNVTYFPAYEIMMDDLRDYRFYKADMIHPSDEAEAYIWSLFADTFFNDRTKELINRWQEIQTALNHKPFHPGSEDHRKFLRNMLKKLKALPEEMDVSGEVNRILNDLTERI